jgi:hypothetical protein
LGLALVLGSAATVVARGGEPPPPGTQRLIRIGPVALVCEDEHGNVTMAEDPTPAKKHNFNLLPSLFGALVGGAVGTLYNDPGRVSAGMTFGGVAGLADQQAPPVQGDCS